MARVIGIGGVFVKAKDPKALSEWYRDVLGMEIKPWGGAKLDNGPGTYTVWNAMGDTTEYMKPTDRPFMINLRVDDLAGLLARLREKNANVLDRGEDTPYGKFGYVVDPEGTLLELFQPA